MSWSVPGGHRIHRSCCSWTLSRRCRQARSVAVLRILEWFPPRVLESDRKKSQDTLNRTWSIFFVCTVEDQRRFVHNVSHDKISATFGISQWYFTQSHFAPSANTGIEQTIRDSVKDWLRSHFVLPRIKALSRDKARLCGCFAKSWQAMTFSSEVDTIKAGYAFVKVSTKKHKYFGTREKWSPMHILQAPKSRACCDSVVLHFLMCFEAEGGGTETNWSSTRKGALKQTPLPESHIVVRSSLDNIPCVTPAAKLWGIESKQSCWCELSGSKFEDHQER